MLACSFIGWLTGGVTGSSRRETRRTDLQEAANTVEHNRFADENRMHSYRLSAKSGDQVHACFTRVAALLAGVKMSGTDIARKSRAVPATVLTHQQHDPQVLGGEMPEHKRGKKSSCLVS